MLVYFLRHADAEPDAASDYDRKLTTKGLDQAEKAGKFCLRNGLLPGIIISSPVVRAEQTAKIVSEKLSVELIEGRWLACGMSPSTCLEELAAFSRFDSVMLVGHEPDFSAAIASMIGLADPGNVNIRKSSLTAIDMFELKPSHGILQFSVPVRLM